MPELLGVRMMVVVLKDAFGPEGEMVTERVTVPLKPFKLVRVTSEDTAEDRARLRELGAALMEKSETMTLMVTERVSEPLVPVMITV